MKPYNDKKEFIKIKDWLNRAENKESHEWYSDIIEEQLNTGISLNSVSRCASQLGNSSIWFGSSFLFDVWEGNERSKYHGALMLDYKFWRVRILTHRFDLLKRSEPGVKSAINYFEVYPLYSLLLTFSRWKEADWLGARILGSNEDMCFDSWKMDRAYAGFVLKLHLVMEGRAKPEEPIQGLPDCGVYEGLFTNWTDSKALEHCIIEVCDEHYVRTLESMEKKLGIVEFVLRPYNVLPIEVLAFRAARRRMGLSTPLPLHPMLDSPFVNNLAENLPPVSDPILERVVSETSEIFPEVCG